MEMLVKMTEVLCRSLSHDDGPGGVPAPPGESPPPSSSSPLPSPLVGEGFPLLSMASIAEEGQEPLRDWICLSVSLCFCVLRFCPFTVCYIPGDP